MRKDRRLVTAAGDLRRAGERVTRRRAVLFYDVLNCASTHSVWPTAADLPENLSRQLTRQRSTRVSVWSTGGRRMSAKLSADPPRRVASATDLQARACP